MTPLTLGDIAIGGGSPFVLIAGPVRHRERAARHRSAPASSRTSRARPACPSSSRRRTTRPTARRAARSAARARRRAARAGGDQSAIAAFRFSPTSTSRRRRRAAADVADVLQIPAFLCRQTDLLVAAAQDRTGRQHQEGSVPRARRREARGGEGRRTPATRASSSPSAARASAITISSSTCARFR